MRHMVGGLDASTAPPKERYAVPKDNVIKLIQPGVFDDQLTEVLRNGARALLARAVEAEVADFLDEQTNLKTANAPPRVVRPGHFPEREVMTGIGPVRTSQCRPAGANPVRSAGRCTAPAVIRPQRRRSFATAVRHRMVSLLRGAGEYDPVSDRSGPCIVWHLRDVVLNDLPAGGEPDIGMRTDIGQSRVESADTVRLARDERMHGDRHHTAGGLAFAVERIELPAEHHLELRNRNFHIEVSRHIVGLYRIGQRDHRRRSYP